MGAAEVMREVGALADPAQAATFQRFFKTGPGEYGEGDVFAGVKVPPLREIARHHRGLEFAELEQLLASEVHEHRTVALVILTERAARADLAGRQEVYDFYLAHLARVNNWDLVDLSCREIVGGLLLETGDFSQLTTLAESIDLWVRRVGIVSTWTLIRAGIVKPTFELCALVEDDPRDLTHKAAGWMLREAGKRDPRGLDSYLELHASTMPRTTLRYAIERMSRERRAHWRSRKTSEQKEQ